MLPKFDKPPVIEMVLGVEFADLVGLGIPYYGLFWGLIRDEYPLYIVKEPAPSRIEIFEEQGKQEITFNLPVLGPPPMRFWYINSQQTWLLQLQQDRFIQNWRKTASEPTYSHYTHVRDRFEKEFQRFQGFIDKQRLGPLQIRQCEISYVNQIELEKKPGAPFELAEISPYLSFQKREDFLPPPDGVTLNTSYVIPENRGRLYIGAQTLFRHSDAKEILQVSVTAKVIPVSQDYSEVMNALDLGHEWAARGFADFTSDKMHRLWERRQ
jgi:uncharacterized protein (TIGR04255 family)